MVSLTLEADLWLALDQICDEEKTSLETIIHRISDEWLGDELPSALWQYAITYFRARSDPKYGRAKADIEKILRGVRGGMRGDC